MDKKAPFFSVVIPLYNKEADIQNTLNSLLKQSFSDFEVIIINDGSTDASEAKVSAIKDPRLTLFTKKNEGVAKTRNYGVHKASANYIAFLDADDYWHNHHLENLHSIVQAYPKAQWYATAYEKQYHNKLILPLNSPILKKDHKWKGIIENYFQWSLKDPLAWTSAVCMKTSFFKEINGFDATITMGAGEDTDLWLRAALKAPLVFSREITARHNLDSSNRLSKISAIKRQYINLDKYEGYCDQTPYLKAYLDSNRYGIALHHKLAGDIETYKKLKARIDFKHLNRKQKTLLNQSRTVLRLLKWAKEVAHKLGLRPSSF